jgi:hypothetical protein
MELKMNLILHPFDLHLQTMAEVLFMATAKQ